MSEKENLNEVVEKEKKEEVKEEAKTFNLNEVMPTKEVKHPRPEEITD